MTTSPGHGHPVAWVGWSWVGHGWAFDTQGLVMDWSWIGHGLVMVGPGLVMGWSWIGLCGSWIGHGLVMGWSWVGHGLVMGSSAPIFIRFGTARRNWSGYIRRGFVRLGVFGPSWSGYIRFRISPLLDSSAACDPKVAQVTHPNS